ncbi:MAG: MFS transporter [Sulfurospirillaceae bacterium]|nr:MFS transporter [Sulfurospirillaceae bacterium]
MKKFDKGEVLTISFSHFAHDIYSSFLAPMLPFLISKLGISLSEASLFDIARRIPALFNPLFGLMAEKSSIKYIVIFTPSITAISMSLLGLANSYILALILLFVAGLSAALYHIPSPVMIKEASGSKVGTGMSFFMVGGEGARTVGPLVITGAISLWGLDGTYRLVPFGLLASALLFYKLRNFHLDTSLRKKREKGDTKKFLVKYYPFFTGLGGFLMFQSAMKSVLVLYLPVYLMHHGADIWRAGISLSVLEFFGVAGTLFAGSYSDKIGRHNMLLISTVMSAVFMVLFVLFHSVLLFPILAVLGFFLFASGPVLMASVQDLNSHMPTFANSLYMSVNFGVSSIVVFMIGLSGDYLGLDITYKVTAALAFVCIPFTLFLKKIMQGLKNEN